MSSPLTAVDLVLRHQRDGDALQQLERTICSFLGPSPYLSLSQACALGSIELLQWIWDSSCTSPRTRQPRWSLHNFLRSDVHYYRYQFSNSMEVAACRDNLAMVEWLDTHFSGCEVPSGVPEAAARNGNLPILQFLLAHDGASIGGHSDAKKKKQVETEDGGVKAQIQGREGNRVQWGRRVMSLALSSKHPDVVRWLHENMPDGKNERDREREIECALRNGDVELAKFLMPPGRCVLDYATCSGLKMIEWMLDCGYVQRDIGHANSAIGSLAYLGRLDLMQQIVLLHSPPRKHDTLCLHSWWNAIVIACERGYLEMLKWLMDHPLGQELCGNMKAHDEYLIRLAGPHDQTEIMGYLYEQGGAEEIGVVREYAAVFMTAIRDGRCKMVRWLIENIPFPNFGQPGDMAIAISMIDLTQNEDTQANQVAAWWSRSRNVMDFAAGSGHVDMFKWLMANHPQTVTKDAMDRAACCGHLEMVQWLHQNRSEGCTTTAMDEAASRGHFEVVKWLHSNREEGCTQAAMDGAAEGGHLEIVKWLHINRSEGCTKKAMDGAARKGHLNTLKWLCANRSEGCNPKAIYGALKHGHLAVLDWLHAHFPAFTPPTTDIPRNTENMFEVLLFLHEHFAQIITPDYIAMCRRFGTNADIVAWLKENCLKS
ncbi:hypothetical protein PR003_g14053 [Phytophthora rubi]|uniref:Uncharacterized protein n=1 Tax=Phytophthora rubi TaxID=129364 RepID=A0A6A4F6I2_9STRA|nr:hypothetical protein PR002_g13148 [Phytophthora rubi]KAE9023577.1 hypothetical protein PR001_g12869 [Phytophthora rubi]KAE9333370.1 hypothetical protein PR003_g14053 [Phytophthora rubi]